MLNFLRFGISLGNMVDEGREFREGKERKRASDFLRERMSKGKIVRPKM